MAEAVRNIEGAEGVPEHIVSILDKLTLPDQAKYLMDGLDFLNNDLFFNDPSSRNLFETHGRLKLETIMSPGCISKESFLVLFEWLGITVEKDGEFWSFPHYVKGPYKDGRRFSRVMDRIGDLRKYLIQKGLLEDRDALAEDFDGLCKQLKSAHDDYSEASDSESIVEALDRRREVVAALLEKIKGELEREDISSANVFSALKDSLEKAFSEKASGIMYEELLERLVEEAYGAEKTEQVEEGPGLVQGLVKAAVEAGLAELDGDGLVFTEEGKELLGRA